jgi:hypothetical protein
MKLIHRIKALFGKTIVRFEGTTTDGSTFISTVELAGLSSTFDDEKIFQCIEKFLLAKTGETVERIRIIDRT